MDVIERVLIDEKTLKEKVKQLAAQISKDYAGKTLTMIGVLKGSVPFMADLLRLVTVDVEIDFMAVSSYANQSKSTGIVKILKDLDININNKHILIVEDIIDSGRTLAYLRNLLLSRNPADLKICTILNKPERREIDIDVDYIGFDIPDEFVVGYGLDYAQKYRNYPFVGVLKRSIYEK